MAEEALGAAFWDVEAEDPIGPLVPKHQRDAAKQKIHGRDSRIGQSLKGTNLWRRLKSLPTR